MNEFISYFILYRICWIKGRMGFGKTALAVILAEELMKRGLVDGVITNFPTIFPPHKTKDDGTLRNRLIIYDEAWVDLDSRTSMTNDRAYSAYARKFGCYWLFPSVHAVDKRLRAVTVKPSHQQLFTGKTVWKYELTDDEKKPTEGNFTVDTRRAYGKYATSYIPVGDCGISDRFQVTYFEETGELWKNGNNRGNKEASLREANLEE